MKINQNLCENEDNRGNRFDERNRKKALSAHCAASLTLFCRVAMNVGSIYFQNHIAGFNLRKRRRGKLMKSNNN
jgi:hypothetical protein